MAKIASLNPDIVIVDQTVSRIAQEYILDEGITLILNCKSSIMASLSRLTGAVIVEGHEGLNIAPKLGMVWYSTVWITHIHRYLQALLHTQFRHAQWKPQDPFILRCR